MTKLLFSPRYARSLGCKLSGPNDLDMLRNCDIPCLVFNDQFKQDQINIDNLIVSNKPSPEGWADVIKTALVKLNY